MDARGSRGSASRGPSLTLGGWTMRRLMGLGAAVLLAGCAGSIAMNSEVSGSLARSDARLNDGSVYQAWTFYGTQGQMVQIDVMSDAFDAFCILQGPNGNELARDDDSG